MPPKAITGATRKDSNLTFWDRMLKKIATNQTQLWLAFNVSLFLGAAVLSHKYGSLADPEVKPPGSVPQAGGAPAMQ